MPVFRPSPVLDFFSPLNRGIVTIPLLGSHSIIKNKARNQGMLKNLWKK